ncbi:hypothetical protein SRHO_G00064620 [Serrasalmus rhombeus]
MLMTNYTEFPPNHCKKRVRRLVLKWLVHSCGRQQKQRGSRQDSGRGKLSGRRFWFSLNVCWRVLSQKMPSVHLEGLPEAREGNGCWACLALWEVWVPRVVITL